MRWRGALHFLDRIVRMDRRRVGRSDKPTCLYLSYLAYPDVALAAHVNSQVLVFRIATARKLLHPIA